MQKYAFLDRDGTIIWELGRDDDGVAIPPKTIKQVKFMDNAIEGMNELRQKGYRLVLATNQAYLGSERNPQDIFDTIMDFMYQQLANHGIRFEYVMVCPHGPEENCKCRKPKIGGLDNFLTERKGKIDLSNSIMFGDRDSDREFADNLGAGFVKIKTNGSFLVPK